MTASPPPSTGDGDGQAPAVDDPSPVDPRFAIPLVTNVVLRARLHARLTDVASPCVVIAAPAGWGKTLLAGSWLAAGAAQGLVVWISLSPADNDLRSFWTSVADAMVPLMGNPAGAVLRTAVADDDLELVPGRLAAALALEATPVVLVLDNLHEVTDLAVHESLLRLVQRPPRGLRLVVTTRRDPPWPLNKLRLAGLLSEIRADELAFRADEARAMFDGLHIDLDDVHVGRLVARTDGWAAGLRLAALELQGAADPAAFVDAFSGDDHAVAAYLLDEVIDGLAPDLLDFLVRVSVLDVVSAALADAVTGRRDSAATLAELAASNLFVQAVGTGGRWYRMHRLIADVLRPRLTQPRTFRDLHRRAAQWYSLQAMPLEAVRYALRGTLWPLAAEILGVHVLTLVVTGNPRELDLLLTAVPRAVLLDHPELAAALAAARVLQGSPRELGELSEAARAGVGGLSERRAERLRVVLDLIDIGNGRASGDLAGVVAACRRIPQDPVVLAALGLAAWDVVPLLVLGNTGMAEFWMGAAGEAERHLRAATNTDRSAGVLRPHLNAAAHLALLRCEQGDLDAAHDCAQSVARQATDVGWGVSAQVAAAYLALAWVALDRDDQHGVESWFARIAEVEAVIPEPHVQVAAAALAALRRADAGDPVGALSGLRMTAATAVDRFPPALADRLSEVQADLLCLVGDVAQARGVLAGLHHPATPGSARALARLHLAEGDFAAAEQVLAAIPDDGATVRGQVEGAALLSVVLAPSDRATALSRLDNALRTAAPLGMRRPFLVRGAEMRELLSATIEAGTPASAFALDLVRRMSGQGGRPPAAIAATLTDREQLVLRYLSSTLSNAEIAAELYLSVNTIKTHQRMVYRKLGAAGRRDAVRRAKELRLL